MTNKEQLNKRAEEKEFDAKMIKAYAEIVECLEQRQSNWYGTTFTDDSEMIMPMVGFEAEWQAYTNVIEAILKLAK